MALVVCWSYDGSAVFCILRLMMLLNMHGTFILSGPGLFSF
jgi:hypothetical protein